MISYLGIELTPDGRVPVLILIVVEDDLVPRVIHRVQTTISLVLILIVVEDGLVPQLLLRMLFATLS